MPTNITELNDPERDRVVLRVEGELLREDALLLEKIALEMKAKSDQKFSIDLADLHLMDSESAPVVKRLREEHGIEIEGLEFFLQKIVDQTENRP